MQWECSYVSKPSVPVDPNNWFDCHLPDLNAADSDTSLFKEYASPDPFELRVHPNLMHELRAKTHPQPGLDSTA